MRGYSSLARRRRTGLARRRQRPDQQPDLVIARGTPLRHACGRA